MYIEFPPTAEPQEISSALDKLGYTPERRVIACRYPDGSYRVIGEIIKDADCPQEYFDFALKQLAAQN